MINILILILWCLTKMSIEQESNICETDSSGKNVCHDGGCNNPKSVNNDQPCLCHFTDDFMEGQYCGVYVDYCATNYCQNGKCKSGIGHPICECTENFYGGYCDIPVTKGDKSIKLKKVSIYYRIKYELGTETYLLLVSETFGDNNYDVIIKSVFDFRFKLNDYKQKNIEVSKVVEMCSTTLQSESGHYNVNHCDGPDNVDCQNMCQFIPRIYGANNKVEIALIGPFFNTKTFIGNAEEIYFDSESRENRMGLRLYPELSLISTDKKEVEYKIRFIQFIIETRDFMCYPFINEIQYTRNEAGEKRTTKEMISESSTIKIKGNEDWEFIIYYEFESKCDRKIYDMDPKNDIIGFSIFNTDKPIESYKNSKGLPVDASTVVRDGHKLIIRNPPLQVSGTYVFYFYYARSNAPSVMITNYLRFVEITMLLRLVAKITGDSPIRLGQNNTLTLSASESYNPNEKITSKKRNLLFMWECDIAVDDGCKKFSTSESTRTLKLTEPNQYKFTLTVSMDQNYITNNGKPPEGVAYIIVIPYIFPLKIKNEINIKCIMNCKPLLNPKINLHLETKANFIGNDLKWYYQQLPDTNMISVDNISLVDVPTKMLVVKKNSLEYGTTYTFIVKDPKYELMESRTFTTVGKPVLSGCTIRPQSGVAGETLFNISCVNFTCENNNKCVFEYFQKNKNDITNNQSSQLGNSTDLESATNGVLLYRGNEALINVKLSCSKYLTVRVINEYGITADVNLLVDISECIKNLLNTLFKELKTAIINKDNSRAITIIAILSDTLHDYHMGPFVKLFMALNQIQFHDCIPCTYQFLLILQKVINDYNSSIESKINIAELISKQMFRVSDSLRSFLKIHDCDDRWEDTETIDKIKEILRNIWAPLQNSLFKYNDEKDVMGRYYWSSIESIKITTHNVEKYLTSFGNDIILDTSTYDRAISCADGENYNFKTCIASPEWLGNRTRMESNSFMWDIVGQAMASELLSRGGLWGVTIFNVDNDLKRTFDNFGEIKVLLPIVSLDITNFNQMNPRKIYRYKEFNNYFDLHFTTNGTIKRRSKKYTIQTPAPNSNNLEFDKIIFVGRIDMTNIGELYVTINKYKRNLRFTWIRSHRPDTEIMKNESYSHTLKAGRKYKYKLKTHFRHRNKIHYIGISVDMNEHITENKTSNVKFSMDIFGPQCLYWTGLQWSPIGIIVAPNSTENDIHCITNHASLFTGILLTLPDVENPFLELDHIEKITNNFVCLSVTFALFFVYLILLGWSRYQDNKDLSKGKIIILNDNYPGEDEVYCVTVYTGNMHEAGTTANVCIQLHGNATASRAHWLNGSGGDVLQRFHDDKFIIFTMQSLGDLKYIRIWHDSYGNHPNWYCRRIEVTDVRKEKTWYFEVERWFSLHRGLENTAYTILAESHEKRKIRIKDEVILNLRESHIWISVFLRHPRSLKTRCQRLSCILCAQLGIMLTNLLFYRYLQSDDEEFLTLKVTIKQIWISLFSALIQTLLKFLTSYFFNESTKLHEYSVQNQVRDSDNDDKFKKTWWNKLLGLVANEKLYLPAQTEINHKNSEGKKNLIIGWTMCIGVYIFTTFFIILCGLKFGKVKSLYWLTTIVIGALQSTFLVEPLCVVISTFIWWLKSDKEQNKINNFQIKLDHFRKNSKYLLNDFQLIQRIRKKRYKYVYSPITKEQAQELQNRQNIKMRSTRLRRNVIICLLLILLSLCCRSALYNTYTFFTPGLIRTNIIHKEFLENLLTLNKMDLIMIKTFLLDSLIPQLLVKEYYNGLSLVAKHINIVRGRFILYDSKLINAGMRLIQNRMNNDGYEDDGGVYTEGWIRTNELEHATAWTYRSIPNIKYFNIWSPDKMKSGFILDLTGGLSDFKNDLNTHLINGWLDNKTTHLTVEFQIYTPVSDCITVFQLRFKMAPESLFDVNMEVWSVPSSSAFIEFFTQLFTLVSVCAYAAAAVFMATAWITRPAWAAQNVGVIRTFWATYERALVALVMLTVFALAGRRTIMKVANDRYEWSQETVYAAGITDTCHAHDDANMLVSLIAFATAVRVFALMWSSVG